MAADRAQLLAQDYARNARDLLAESDRKFASRKHLSASEMIWQATAQAIMAVAVHRGWHCDGTRLSLRNTIEQLAEDEGDSLISLKYVYAENFRDNAKLDFMEYRELAYDSAKARDFIRCLLAKAC
ncbi:MAG: hypothetical protein OXL37_08190 [Chloroflexota bacterium]|nr:hypothetical protein [Chloroflexota bacterium]MDE2958633.1 hypothetical protein [Chloroflexota bacterium]